MLVSWLGQTTESPYAKDTRPVFRRGKKKSMVSILDVIWSSSTSGHHTNVKEITAKVPRSRNRIWRILFQNDQRHRSKCRDYVNKYRWEVSCPRRLRKQTRKRRDRANTEIDRTTTEINAEWSRSSEYIWRIPFNIIAETKTTISISIEYSRRILFKIITKINVKVITSRGYRWRILFKMNTEMDAKMMISRGHIWNILFEMNTEINAKMTTSCR